MEKFLYDGKVVTRDELYEKVLAEVAPLDTHQWVDGEFDFDAWLSEAILDRTVQKVDL